MFSITGKLKEKFDTVQVRDNFKKREFVLVEESSNYPQTLLFQLIQDKCSELDAVEPGQQIKVNFNLNGREWTNPKTNEVKVFNSLNAWKIEAVDPQTNAAPPAGLTPPASFDPGEDDDLPF